MITLKKELLSPSIGVVEQEYAFSRQAVPARASNLLVIGFDRTGDVIVNDKSNVAFVYSHAKRIGGDDRLDATGHKTVLRSSSLNLPHPAVIRLNAETSHFQLG